MVEALVGVFIVMVLLGAFCMQIKVQTIVWRSVRDVLREEDFEAFKQMRW